MSLRNIKMAPYHEQGRQCHGSNNPNIVGQLEIETFTLNTDLSVGGTWQCQAANWFLRLNHDFAFTSGARGAGGRGHCVLNGVLHGHFLGIKMLQ